MQGIPCLVLLSARGELISTEGVDLLLRHERRFPWRDTAKQLPQTPHHQPLYERLQRPDAVDPGSPYDLPKYKPIDFLCQPAAVRSCEADPERLRPLAFAECVAVLVECDALCTLSMVQVIMSDLLPPDLLSDGRLCLSSVPCEHRVSI